MDKGYINKFSIENIKTEEKIKEPYSEYEMNLLLKTNPLNINQWILVFSLSISTIVINEISKIFN